LKEFTNAYSISEDDLKHEILLAQNVLWKASQLPTSLEQRLSSLQTCVWLFIQVVTNSCLLVTSASCEKKFSKMKLVKTFLRNYMTS